ncbi:MAG: hypothetical protein JSR90_10825 [Proteobacteria bacterium]|nr:hypothetical protein [Pseudomonadota bacterium]
MMMRSFKWAAGMSLVAATLTLASVLPASAQGTLQAVPRAGVSFANTVTVRATVETVDPETRTVAFTTSNGRLHESAVSEKVHNLDAIEDGSTADITYNEVITLLNLRQKGPGSHQARNEATGLNASDIESGRFTMVVVGVDLAANKVSLIDPRGGQVRTLAATSIAKQDMLKKIKVGDVVIGIATPLLVTAITPAK